MRRGPTSPIVVGRIGVLERVVGAVVVLLIQEIIARLRARKGVVSGEWEQIVPQQNSEAEKHDHVVCRHIGNKISGHITRLLPHELKFKRWRFEGQMRVSLVFLTFWPVDAAKNPGSYGTIRLHMIDEKQLQGFYVKL